MRLIWLGLVIGLWGQDRALPPAGFGSLRQDEIAVRLRHATFEFRLLPLDERVIRLLAPDSYNSLAALKQSKSEEVQRAAERHRVERPTLMLATLFAVQPGVRFEPDLLTVGSRGRIFRALEIIPISPDWGQQQIPQRTQLIALYIFDAAIPTIDDVFEVEYEGVVSLGWQRSRRLLEAELTRAFARAAQDTAFQIKR